jgi:hypothetical protein
MIGGPSSCKAYMLNRFCPHERSGIFLFMKANEADGMGRSQMRSKESGPESQSSFSVLDGSPF